MTFGSISYQILDIESTELCTLNLNYRAERRGWASLLECTCNINIKVTQTHTNHLKVKKKSQKHTCSIKGAE